MIRDVLARADLTLWPQFGLAVFFLFFVLMALRTMRTSRTEMDRNAQLPLNDDQLLTAKD